MKIRAMTQQDWQQVAQIYEEGISTGIATFQSDIPTYSAWNNSHIESCRLVAEENGKILGWTSLSPVSSRCVYAGVCEVSVYVDDCAKRKGIGSKLLNALIAESEKQGIWMLQSGIMQNNVASIRVHEKCGFRMAGYRERIGKDINGKWCNTVLMEHRCTSDDI